MASANPASTRLYRSLSAFNPFTRTWELIRPVSSSLSNTKSAGVTQRNISLISWNINAFFPRATARAKLILSHILGKDGTESKAPDIIFLQEITSGVRDSLLCDPRVRAAWLITDAEDQAAFDQVPFATMTLLSRGRFTSEMLGCVWRTSLPSKYKRDALCVDIKSPAAAAMPATVIRLINVHLDSLGHTLEYRAHQLETVANMLREPGCSGEVVAGDFNAISPRDHELINENKLVDAWISIHGLPKNAQDKNGGNTWGVGVERKGGPTAGRLDKVATVGIHAKTIELLQPGCIEVPRPGEEPVKIPWSDHHGLRFTFTV